MGSYTSCPIRISGIVDIDQHENDQVRDLVGVRPGIELQGADQGLRACPCSSCSLSSFRRPAIPFSDLIPYSKDNLDYIHDSGSYWVYATFHGDESVRQSFYAFEIYDRDYAVLPRHFVNSFFGSATAVLDKRLYVIGGGSHKFISNDVHMFDPNSYRWFYATPTLVPRQGALAVTVGGKIYVFGGCIDRSETDAWAEVYDPSTELWMPIPGSRILTDALDNGLSMLMRSAVVMGNKIFIRYSTQNGIALDTRSLLWSPVSENLVKHWCNSATAAVVKNMLVTCYYEDGETDILKHSIRAYDPQKDVWLTLQGLHICFHENPHRLEFISMNGMLVIYHMWEPDGDFTFFGIQMDERHKTTVNVDHVWTCRFPRMDNKSNLAVPPVFCPTDDENIRKPARFKLKEWMLSKVKICKSSNSPRSS